MTIIACDGKIIAADSMEVCGGIITTLNSEKIRVTEGVIYAMTGPAPMWEPLIAWHRGGHSPESVPKASKDDAWSFVVIDRSGIIKQYCDGYAHADVFVPPWAWGSHRDIALGAMYAGKTAAEAVAIVCERTTGAGGEIQVVNIAEALGLEHGDKTANGRHVPADMAIETT